ncbi:MAG: SagB/ThcOx family dehydrogenase [Trueperaceae bacterium]|nr:MAG: SagB/ThcOx family dehydrogenase [Trueperaceae bacterium]
MSNSKEKSIGASFHVQTKYRRGQLPSRSGKAAPAFKVYANPLEVASLPVPDLSGGKGFWSALSKTREHTPEGGRLRQKQVSQILWSAAGFTYGKQRTHLSVLGVSAIETYLIVRSVQDMFAGVYHYNPRDHTLEYLQRGDPSEALGNALFQVDDIDAHAAALVFTGIPARLESGAKDRAYRYLYHEAGAAAQCAVISAVSLGLVATFRADYYDDELARLLQVDGVSEVPLCVVLLSR